MVKENLNVVNVNNSNVLQTRKSESETITSLELVEQINEFRKAEKDDFVELKHNDLLKVIRDEFEEEISLGKISQSKYTNSRGRKYPMFNLTYSQAKQVLVRESKFVRKQVIVYLEKLENSLKSVMSTPQSFAEALKLAYEQQLLIEQQNKVIEEQKPKVEFYDMVVQSEDTIDIGSVAKVLNFKGVGRNKLFAILKDEEILMGNNQPYQKFLDSKWFKVVETSWVNKEGDVQIYLKTVVYQKGVDRISAILKTLGYKQNEKRK